MTYTMLHQLVTDSIEIIFFTTLIYYFSLWMRKDRQKNLLGYFYAYLLTILVSYAAQLNTIYLFLVITSPIALVLFVVAHQETLQRNLVALRNIVPAQRNEQMNEWLETVIRSFLIASTHNKELYCVIEHYDSLSTFMSTEKPLNVPIKPQMLDILFESSAFNSSGVLWINSQGSIVSVDAIMHHGQNNVMNHALLITAQTDAIIFSISPHTRAFTIIAAGQPYNNISALHALSTIKKYLHAPHKGESYVEANRKNTPEQSTH